MSSLAYGRRGASPSEGQQAPHLLVRKRGCLNHLKAARFSASPSLVEAAVSEPEWISPLADEGYEEFWNERFLERLELEDHLESFRELLALQALGERHR